MLQRSHKRQLAGNLTNLILVQMKALQVFETQKPRRKLLNSIVAYPQTLQRVAIFRQELCHKIDSRLS